MSAIFLRSESQLPCRSVECPLDTMATRFVNASRARRGHRRIEFVVSPCDRLRTRSSDFEYVRQ